MRQLTDSEVHMSDSRHLSECGCLRMNYIYWLEPQHGSITVSIDVSKMVRHPVINLVSCPTRAHACLTAKPWWHDFAIALQRSIERRYPITAIVSKLSDRRASLSDRKAHLSDSMAAVARRCRYIPTFYCNIQPNYGPNQ